MKIQNQELTLTVTDSSESSKINESPIIHETKSDDKSDHSQLSKFSGGSKITKQKTRESIKLL